ncbi:MAG: class I SAM-dependent methyltransferase [Hyphomicrobium sp.]|uniref:class I SAM-dependent methyltransferase n=1 Tax=Hyphomicrobium sp. TaxID=82 RepID=UPI003567D847
MAIVTDNDGVWQVDRQETRKFFEAKWRQGVDLGSTPWVTTAVGKELQDLLINQTLKEDMKVLDIGCGIGVEACFLAKHGMRVTGIDFIPETIRSAEEYAGIVGASVDFRCTDFLSNRSEIGSGFDLVFDQGCFHHIPIAEREEYAKRAYGCLSQNGLLFIRAFSDLMLPSPTNDGPIRLSSDDILSTFSPFFSVEHLYRFKNIPLPRPWAYKPQIFWSFLARKR